MIKPKTQLTKNEMRVCSALRQSRSSLVEDIAKRANMTKGLAYDALESLVKKRVVSFETKEVKFYSLDYTEDDVVEKITETDCFNTALRDHLIRTKKIKP